MTPFRPTSMEALCARVSQAAAAKAALPEVNLNSLDRILTHRPEDMTIRVETGLPFIELQKHLARFGQWLPLDGARARGALVGDVIAHNLSGPSRLGFGTVRDYVIGLKAILADGRVAKSGGNVVKNVAGYDLMKLWIGARHALGIVVEATFKVLPLPEVMVWLKRECSSLLDCEQLFSRIWEGPSSPVALDVVQWGDRPSLMVAYAGTREDVDWQTAEARRVGLDQVADDSYDIEFWDGRSGFETGVSVLPSGLFEVLNAAHSKRFLARAGNGVIYGLPAVKNETLPNALLARTKQVFDPDGIFPVLEL